MEHPHFTYKQIYTSDTYSQTSKLEPRGLVTKHNQKSEFKRTTEKEMRVIVRHGMKEGMVVTFHEESWSHQIENSRCEVRRGFLCSFLGSSETLTRVPTVEILCTKSCDDKNSPE